MCGLCGFTGSSNHDLLRRMTDSLHHRGPDDSGYYESDALSLGLRRLSIIDVAGGHQPISNENGSVWVVFNGEIYNHMAIRDDLEDSGHRFSTLSDTEVVAHAYEEFGPRCVDHLWGMFAFAVWDEPRETLMLARDRIGMKPLYYARTSDGLTFASEIKSLLVHPHIRREPDLEALRLLLSFRYIPDDRTAFLGIHKLMPATVLLWREGREEVRQYWHVPVYDLPSANEAAVVVQIRSLLNESGRSHLIAGREVRRYATVVLVGEGSDEQFSGYVSNLHFSRARRYRSLAPSALARERIQLLADSVPFLRHQKRALEFLGSLKNQNLALRIMNSTLFSELELSAAASARFMKKTRNVDLDGLYTPLFRAVKGNEDIVASYVDLSTFVPHDVSMRVDKMMMPSSVEARMPFLHVPILEYMPSVDPQLKIKHGIPKYLLRQAMKDDIPEKVLTRRKHGIQVPICRWVKQNIGILEQLSLDFARSRDILEKDAVVRIVKRAEKGGDKNAAHHLFAIGTLELWHKMYVDPEHWAPGEPQSITRVM